MRKIALNVAKDLNKNFPEIDLEELRSDDELFYLCWLLELCHAGYVDNVWYESKTFDLNTPYEKLYEVQMKTKVKTAKEVLIKGTRYTPDFKVEWTEKAVGVFYLDYVTPKRVMSRSKALFHLGENMVSHVEIKPDHDQNNMTSYARVKINWLFETQKVYVNMVKVPTLFRDTFVPLEFTLTEKKREKRKFKYAVKVLKEYLDIV